MRSRRPHLAILGAGPTGLDAALAAAEGGFPFTVYEAAPRVAGHVADWRHVRLFTPWSMNASPRMRRHLAEAGRPVPDDGSYPTGGELIDALLQPLAELPPLAAHLRLGTRVVGIGREGLLKHEEIATEERARRRFRLLLRDDLGRERVAYAGAVLDCTGASQPNALGDGGIPAPGEASAAGVIRHDIPDFAGENGAWAGRTVLLVGGGHSAQTAARDFLQHVASAPGSRLIWAVKSEHPTWGEVADDPLPARAELAAFARRLAASPPPAVELRTAAVVEALAPSEDGVEVVLRRPGGAETVRADRVLALVGRVGDHRLYRQLQVHECYATCSPMKLAAALLAQSGAGGDCLAQTSLGPETLRNPEPRFFILGMKSYGRRNDYLMRVGFEQVDEAFRLLEE
ncbi:MAG: hypothetical protein D6696_04870 [Acidobacteria bacterium]|nr:MAG: hypothetical protein D6696_04870 [Acidobacteriota bacterium]